MRPMEPEAIAVWLYVLALAEFVMTMGMVFVAGVLFRKLMELGLRLEWMQSHIVLIGESIDEWSDVREAKRADRPVEAGVVESD